MKKVLISLLIIYLLSVPVAATSIEINLNANEACAITEIVFKSYFSGNYISKGFNIDYENYAFTSITYDEKTCDWIVTYDLTDEGYYRIFGFERGRYFIFSDEWVSHVSFYINKNSCEIPVMRVGHTVAFTLSNPSTIKPEYPVKDHVLLASESDAILVSNILFKAIFTNDIYSSISIKENIPNHEWQISYYFDNGSIFEIHINRGTLKIGYLGFQN